jgi:hypothetical protein
MSEPTIWSIVAAPDRRLEGVDDEPSHIHIPRPSRLRRLNPAAAPALDAARLRDGEVQLALENVA